MTQSTDPTDLATRLIAAKSVTPATGAVFDAITPMLEAAGFAVTRYIDGSDDPDPENGGPVENLLATRGSGGRHFAFAGHLDVVPPGEGWESDAFAPEIRGGLLYGRGAVDMKGAIACFIAATQRIPADAGTISLIITGDEEGAAIHGTRALMQHMAEKGCTPEMILVGEPTSVNRLGDTMKIGRRGSVNMWIKVDGTQGHVAYPHLADNPIAKLVTILNEIAAIDLDQGTDWFQPSNIETTDIAVGNPAHNVIPKVRIGAAVVPLQRSPQGRRSRRPVARHRRKTRRHAQGRRLGRGLPDAAGRIVEPRPGRGRSGHRPPPRSIDQRRHVRRALPLRLVPGGRIRPDQRDDAQARRGGRGRRPRKPHRYLRSDAQPRLRLRIR